MGKNRQGGVNTRRITAIKALEQQLKDGSKILAKRFVPVDSQDKLVITTLTESDIKRINKEIAVLKTRITQ